MGTLCTWRLCAAKKFGEKIELRKTPRRRSAKCALNWNHYNFQIITTFKSLQLFPVEEKETEVFRSRGWKVMAKRENERVGGMIVVERWQKVRAKIDGRRGKGDISSSTRVKNILRFNSRRFHSFSCTRDHMTLDIEKWQQYLLQTFYISIKPQPKNMWYFENFSFIEKLLNI